MKYRSARLLIQSLLAFFVLIFLYTARRSDSSEELYFSIALGIYFAMLLVFFYNLYLESNLYYQIVYSIILISPYILIRVVLQPE